MTFKTFKREILDGLSAGMRWRHSKHLDACFDLCVERWNEKQELEKCCEGIESEYQGRTNKAVPWGLIIAIVVELVKWWLSNRAPEKRALFRGWQKEVKK